MKTKKKEDLIIKELPFLNLIIILSPLHLKINYPKYYVVLYIFNIEVLSTSYDFLFIMYTLCIKLKEK